MKFERHLVSEAKKYNLAMGVRKRMRTAVRKVLKPTYFTQIPLQDLFDAMSKFDVVALQEDNTEWYGFLLGRDESTLFRLGDANKFETKHGYKMYEQYDNVALQLSWYKMPSGKYEVTGYIT